MCYLMLEVLITSFTICIIYCMAESMTYYLLRSTETWLNNGLPDNLLDPESKFNISRCNRNASHGGGVGLCIFVSKSLKYSHVTSISEDGFEAVVVDVFSITSRCRFINLYRKPLYDSGGADHMPKLTSWL